MIARGNHDSVSGLTTRIKYLRISVFPSTTALTRITYTEPPSFGWAVTVWQVTVSPEAEALPESAEEEESAPFQ